MSNSLVGFGGMIGELMTVFPEYLCFSKRSRNFFEDSLSNASCKSDSEISLHGFRYGGYFMTMEGTGR